MPIRIDVEERESKMTMTSADDRPPPRHTLVAQPLTSEAFAPYGDVIASMGPAMPINQGKGQRFADLARVDVTAEAGRAAISRVLCQPEWLPVPLRLMERHPLGSQAFIPLNGQRYIVVVASAGAQPACKDLHAFLCAGDQGINYRRGTWHHPMIALDTPCEFVEFHRAGPGVNCDEVELPGPVQVRIAG